MCQSFQLNCQCGDQTAELFFGNMLLDESIVARVFCPVCSKGIDTNRTDRIWDNGWVLELLMDRIRTYSATFGMPPQDVTAEWIFDSGYVTWVGITPDETASRNRERAEIQKLAGIDVLAYVRAMKQWGVERERRFSAAGWRKMRAR